MSMLTGRYCGSLGVGTNGVPFPDEALALQHLLKPYGYHTAQIGKLHFQPHARRDHRDPHPDYGFDTLILSDEPGCYDDAYIKWVQSIDPAMERRVRCQLPPAAMKYDQVSHSDQPRNTHEPYYFEGPEDLTHSAFVASETCRFLRDWNGGSFLAVAGFYAPHPPLNPPRRFVEMFDPSSLPLPLLGPEEIPSPELTDLSAERRQTIRAYYLALVSHVDDCVGSILETLDETGLTEETIVVFTSDHGEFLGDHGRVQKGMPGFDCITRVPFLVSFPSEIKPAVVSETFCEAVDLVPTILDYCGLQAPRAVQGRSLRPVLQGDCDVHRDDAFTDFFEPFGQRSCTVRTKRHMYHCYSDGRELLYDLEKDPNELEDVSAQRAYGTALSEMRKRMILRIQSSGFNQRARTAEY